MRSNPAHGVFQWLVTGRWFSAGSSVSTTNKTVHHNITEILLNKPNPKTENLGSSNEIKFPAKDMPPMKTIYNIIIIYYSCKYTIMQVTTSTKIVMLWIYFIIWRMKKFMIVKKKTLKKCYIILGSFYLSQYIIKFISYHK